MNCLLLLIIVLDAVLAYLLVRCLSPWFKRLWPNEVPSNDEVRTTSPPDDWGGIDPAQQSVSGRASVSIADARLHAAEIQVGADRIEVRPLTNTTPHGDL